MRIVDVLLAFPSLLLALAIVAWLGRGYSASPWPWVWRVSHASPGWCAPALRGYVWSRSLKLRA